MNRQVKVEKDQNDYPKRTKVSKKLLKVENGCTKCAADRNRNSNVCFFQFCCSSLSVILHGYGKVKEEPYQCIYCHAARTQASQNRTLVNVERYVAIIENIQLIQGFYQNSSQPCN